MFQWFKTLFRKTDSDALDHLTLLSLTEEDVEILRDTDGRIVIGKVIEVTEHPDPKMTKVRVTKTQIGDRQHEQILCGGTNLAPGQIVAVATIGTKLGEDFEIGIRDIRGIESRGMICARKELGLSDAGEQDRQIWPLPEHYESFLGIPLRELLDK